MNISLVAAIVLIGCLLGAGLYESVVIAPNYASNPPISLENAKQFFEVSNPGNYFRSVAPITQVTLLITLILNWRVPERRWWILGALVLAIATDVITFGFHYPRNAILFTDPMNTSVEMLRAAASQWIVGNYVRIFTLLVSMLCALRAAMVRCSIIEAREI
ncbi:MAG: DUF1772 domain-containing protein [Pyrinomonadaceae bacterium]